MKEWTLIHWIVGALVLIGTAAWLGSIVMIDMSGHGSKGTATPDRADDSATLTFNLTDHRGQPVSAESYRGKWLLVFFGFTQCSDICPTGLKTMIRAIDDLEGNTSTVQALFISIDPQRDTPEVLSAYLANYDPRIIGLTSPAESIEEAARSIGVFSERKGWYPHPRHASAIFGSIWAPPRKSGSARERAREAYEKLVPGLLRKGEDFAAVAKQYSEDAESAQNGGELAGWVGESGDLLSEIADHPFHDVVLKLDAGEISEPFEIEGSLYIAEVLERTDPEPLSFEEAKPHIERFLIEDKHRVLAADLQRRLLEEANVEIYPRVLETT